VERKALDAFAASLKPWVEQAFLVLEGEGFKASIQRSVVIGLTFFKERGYTTICKNVDEAVRKIAAITKGDRTALLAAVRAGAVG